jgi:hypothetical protein
MVLSLLGVPDVHALDGRRFVRYTDIRPISEG